MIYAEYPFIEGIYIILVGITRCWPVIIRIIDNNKNKKVCGR